MWWNTFSFTCRSILWNITSSHYTFDSTSKNVSLEGAFECRTSQNGWSSVTSHRRRFWIGCTISALPSQSVSKETKHTGSFHEWEIGEDKLYSISSVSVAYNQHTWYKYRMRTGGMIHTMLFAPMHLFCNKIAMVAWLEEKPADLKSEKTSPCKSMAPFHICSTIRLKFECPRLSVTLRLHRGASTLNTFTFSLRDINKFLRLKPGSDFAGWGCWVCSICMFACTYPLLEVPNSSREIHANSSTSSTPSLMQRHIKTPLWLYRNWSRPDWPKLVRQWIVLVASERRQRQTWRK